MEEQNRYGFPAIALGTWAWGGDGNFDSRGPSAEDLRAIVGTAMELGLSLWDTAWVYGSGRAERILARLLADYPRDFYQISDKLTPQCVGAENDGHIIAGTGRRSHARCLVSPSRDAAADMIEKQLELMGTGYFDIYWIHNNAGAPGWIQAVAQYFEGACTGGRPVRIGVSNHTLPQVEEAEQVLKAHGLKLAGVQNHYSLVNRYSEKAGILDYCRENGIPFFSYMVLEQGALTGCYDRKHPMPQGSGRAKNCSPVLDRFEVLNDGLREAGRRCKAQAAPCSAAQIAIAWALAKGTIPIIGVTKPFQVREAAGAEQIQLTPADVRKLEELADSLDIHTTRVWEEELR